MEQFKAFNVRVPRELWANFKKITAFNDASMNKVVVRLLSEYVKTNSKKHLTSSGTNVK